ncbi:MAG TPA: hypothetical protein VHN11_17475, partial [Xanthobacteraceae bacterium]|nr:hypothetical protein [Xanthobacteraceae bacterium]
LDGAGPAMSSLMKKAPEFWAFAQGATIQNRDGLADSAFISSAVTSLVSKSSIARQALQNLIRGPLG